MLIYIYIAVVSGLTGHVKHSYNLEHTVFGYLVGQIGQYETRWSIY